MPGKVLARHGIVIREGNAFQLHPNMSELHPDEIDKLVRLCEAKLDEYMEKRGATVFAHRGIASGYISGSVRYEVLKRAGGRCELCGVTHEERALEVDHIIPRKEGGPDDLAITKYYVGSAMPTRCARTQPISGSSGNCISTGSQGVFSAIWIRSGLWRKMLLR